MAQLSCSTAMKLGSCTEIELAEENIWNEVMKVEAIMTAFQDTISQPTEHTEEQRGYLSNLTGRKSHLAADVSYALHSEMEYT